MTDKELFREMLKQYRISINAGNRAKTRKQPAGITWLNPIAIEKKYKKYIRQGLERLTKTANRITRENLGRWNKQYKEQTNIDGMEDDPESFQNGINNRFEDLYIDDKGNIKDTITEIGYETAAFNNKQFQKWVKALMKTRWTGRELWLVDVIDRWTNANYTLLKSLGREYVDKLNKTILEGVQYGRSAKDMQKDIIRLGKNMTENRARLIARDQVAKLNGTISKKRMESVGIDKYIWFTANDERVRGKPSGRYPNAIPSHWSMHRKICRWDNSNLVLENDKWVSRSGKMPKVHPGIAIQCRCVSLPYVEEIIKEVDKEIEE